MARVGRKPFSNSRLGSFLISERLQFRSDSPSTGLLLWKNSPARILARIAVFFLLLSVGGLETLAKSNDFLPETNPAHYLSIASKMNVWTSPAILAAKRLPFNSPVVAAQPVICIWRSERFEEPYIRQISLTVSFLHRSPPSLLY